MPVELGKRLRESFAKYISDIFIEGEGAVRETSTSAPGTPQDWLQVGFRVTAMLMGFIGDKMASLFNRIRKRCLAQYDWMKHVGLTNRFASSPMVFSRQSFACRNKICIHHTL